MQAEPAIKEFSHPDLPASQVRAMIEYRQREGHPYLNVRVPVAARMHASAGDVLVPITTDAALQLLALTGPFQGFDVLEECWPEGRTLKVTPARKARGRK